LCEAARETVAFQNLCPKNSYELLRTAQVPIELTDDIRAQLAATFECKASEVRKEVDRYSAAATEEYLTMILGRTNYTRGSDIREYRLLLIIKHVLKGRLPSEGLISRLFQTSITQSRALLRAVMSKYQYELHSAIDATLRETIADASQEEPGGPWYITIDSENVIEHLNRELATLDGTVPQISKKRSSVITYEIANSSYRLLSERFNS
jgi:hypothetical protein